MPLPSLVHKWASLQIMIGCILILLFGLSLLIAKLVGERVRREGCGMVFELSSGTLRGWRQSLRVVGGEISPGHSFSLFWWQPLLLP